ncbi:MAG: hypothetical protein QOC60_1892, partial [Frankiaceae bacterium]|nr:hypothetical protein [Frankiaceae bacterium]
VHVEESTAKGRLWRVVGAHVGTVPAIGR